MGFFQGLWDDIKHGAGYVAKNADSYIRGAGGFINEHGGKLVDSVSGLVDNVGKGTGNLLTDTGSFLDKAGNYVPYIAIAGAVAAAAYFISNAYVQTRSRAASMIEYVTDSRSAPPPPQVPRLEYYSTPSSSKSDNRLVVL